MSFTRFRRRVRFAPKGASRTEQHWRDKQDVNAIVARCMRGDYSDLRNSGLYEDISDMPDDLHGLLNSKIRSEQIFDALPDVVKEKYKTPSEFVAACHDERERENLKSFNLLEKIQEAKPVKVEVINPPSVTPSAE